MNSRDNTSNNFTRTSMFRMLPYAALVLALMLLLISGKGYSALFVNTCIVLAVLIILSQILAIWKEGSGNWMQVDLLFMFVFFVTHFWVWISIQLHGDEVIRWFSGSTSRVNFSVALSLVAMAAFISAFNLTAKKSVPTGESTRFDRNWYSLGHTIFYVGVVCVLLYSIFFGAQAFSGSYAGSSVGNIWARSTYMLQSIFLNLGIAIILLSSGEKTRRIPKAKIAVIVYGAVLIMYLVLGDRSEFIFSLAVFAIAYGRSHKSLSLKYLLIGGFGIALLMSAVQVARTAHERSLSSIADALFAEDEEVSASAGLDNLAASGNVTLIAIQTVPEKQNYFYGKLKLVELMGVLPYGRKLFLSEDDAKLPYRTTSEFMTLTILGPYATTGTGTTLVADLYIDFGVVGIFVGFAMLGWIVRLVMIKADEKRSVMWAVTFCYFAGLLVILPRYSFLKIIRGLLWPLVFLWFVRLLTKNGGKEKSTQHYSNILR